MKKLFKSFGFAVVIAVIALSALLVTGCPDGGLSSDPITAQGQPTNPPDPSGPPINKDSGKYPTMTLGANRWGTNGSLAGENWSSGFQIKLSDFARIELIKGNTYGFRIKGESDTELTRVNIQLFSGSNPESWSWLGTSPNSPELKNLGRNFDETFDVKIEGDLIPGAPIIIQFNNIIWQTNDAGVQIYPEPNTPFTSDINDGDVMAIITNFSINLDNVIFAKAPELCTVDERWWTYVDSTSTATLATELTDGIMTAVVGGTAMPDRPELNSWNTWKARVGYYYTADAGKAYSFKFEAWTKSGTRNLHLQYYENASTNRYLGRDVSINTTRTTYEVISATIPTDGIELLRFHLADQLGTVYIKIIEIKEYVFAGGKLTITNFNGPNIPQNVFIDGYASVYEDEDNITHLYFDGASITNNTLTLNVWQREYNNEGDVISSVPFTGNITVRAGDLSLVLSYDNGYDSYLNMSPVTFTGGSATINDFGSKMDYEGRYDHGTQIFTAKYRITVTGISGKTGHVELGVYSDISTYEGQVLSGWENISGNSVTINLRKNYESNNTFTEGNSYYIRLNFFDLVPTEGGLFITNDEQYYYTNGQTFASLGITSDSDFYDNNLNKLPKYTISSGTTNTINFNLFQKRPESQEWYDSSRITTVTITNIGNNNYYGGDMVIRDPNDPNDYNYSINNKFSSNSFISYFLDVGSDSSLHRLRLYGNGESEEYVYTGGQTFAQLGITSEYDLYGDKLPKYTISSGTATINFSQFQRVPKPYEWYANYKTTTITGIPDNSWGRFYLMNNYGYDYYPIYNTNSYNDNSRTITNTSYWVNYESDTNNYYLVYNSNYYNGSSMVNEYYVYTNGQTLSQLGITSESDLYSKLPKFTISAIPGTIDFSKFVKVPDEWYN